MVKQIHNLVLTRNGNEPFGFRIIGGKDEGLSFKVSFEKLHNFLENIDFV
jgi:hypothetical protein